MFNTEIKDGRQKWQEKWHLWAKNFVEIALFHTVSEINAIFAFYAEIQDGRQNGRKMIFGKSCQQTADTLWPKNLVEIALSRTVIEINALFLCINSSSCQNGGKKIFGKSHQ